MQKLAKIQNHISNKINIYNKILRNFEVILLNSNKGLLIQSLWKEHIKDYGNIKYILLNKYDILDDKIEKYHVICLKDKESEREKISQVAGNRNQDINQNQNTNYYYTNWCIQINRDL